MKRIVPLLITALALSGCVQQYPPSPPLARYYPPPPPSAGHPVHHTAVAAVVPKARPEATGTAEAEKLSPDKVQSLHEGTLTALSVGNYMDGQEKDLRTRLRGSGIVVSRIGDDLVVKIQADHLFDGSAPALSRQGDAIVHTVADSVRRFDSTTLSVNGFTDAAGAPNRDLKLSQMKAEAVDKALVESGVDPHRISAKGFGAGDFNAPATRAARNRRIEIDITPRVKT